MLSVRQVAFRVLIWFAVGFLALFCLRLGYGYCFDEQQPYSNVQVTSQSMVGLFNTFGGNIKNIASYKRAKTTAVAQGGGADQKYEKVANVGLKSRSFEEDEKRVRSLIKSEDALIQYEQRTGLTGERRMRLAIGVEPARFDTFVETVRGFGELTSLSINKSDRTNEFRELKAKRVSLEKTRSALSELKSREGKIGDLVALEKQILELEEKIQALGVSLGDFDSENEFVTVKVLLWEVGNQVTNGREFVRRAFRALEWTVETYSWLLFGLACAMISAFVGVHLVRFGMRVAASAEGTGKS